MTIPVLKSVAELRSICDGLRNQGQNIALVPTMGALHAGHLSLCKLGSKVAPRVIVTIFVNPTQFAPNEDFEAYPRNLDHDLAQCEQAGVFAVFAPSVDEMYPTGSSTRVHVEGLSRHLCGESRPHHFDGVATVVTKLLAATGPCSAIFGKKDYQQLKIVERLVADLLLPVNIVPAPIYRHEDGLAMSSRNQYLSDSERVRARALVLGLSAAERRFESGVRSVSELRRAVVESVAAANLELDYAEIADPETLVPLPDQDRAPEQVLLAVAAKVGSTRLIDNLVLGDDPNPLRSDVAS